MTPRTMEKKKKKPYFRASSATPGPWSEGLGFGSGISMPRRGTVLCFHELFTPVALAFRLSGLGRVLDRPGCAKDLPCPWQSLPWVMSKTHVVLPQSFEQACLFSRNFEAFSGWSPSLGEASRPAKMDNHALFSSELQASLANPKPINALRCGKDRKTSSDTRANMFG